MKIRMPLYAQIFGMLSLYVLTLITTVFIVFNAQFGFGWDALVKSPLGDRVNTIADTIAVQLSKADEKSWNDILKSYGQIHHVKFYMFTMFGRQVGGETLAIPESISRRVPELRSFHEPGGTWFAHPPGPTPDWYAPDGHPHRAFELSRPSLLDGPGSEGPEALPLLGPGPPSDRPDAPDGALPGERFEPPPDSPHVGEGDSPPNFPGRRPRFHIPDELMHAHGQFVVHAQNSTENSTENSNGFWICTRVAVTPKNSSFFMPCILVAISKNIWQSNLLFDAQFILEALAVLLVFSLVFWSPFVFSISHSLSKLTLATEGIAEGKFDTRLDVNRGDEIGRLSEAVNTMAARLTNFVSGQKRFLGDISHELFSPLARLQMALELLSEDATGSQTLLVQDIREEVEEMTNLINELLAFSKAGLKGKDIELTIVNPKTVIVELVERMSLTDKVEMTFQDNIEVTADSLLLGRALSNVLRNSVRYAADKGPISIGVGVQGEQVAIMISDCGPGVPEEALARLAEPFFRPEASRSRSSGGVGLGLAIVKSCVEACQGMLSLRNRAQGGLEVEIRLNRA